MKLNTKSDRLRFVPIPSSLLMFIDVSRYIFRTNIKMIPMTATGIRKYGLTVAATIIAPVIVKMA